MPAYHRVIDQSDISFIPSQSIGFQQLKIGVKTAVATLPPSAAYVTFSAAYGSVPDVTLDMAGTWTKKGSLSYDILRKRPGSFQWVGTPSVRMRWTAWGL